MSLPLHPVISFSVINYVVMMRCPTRVAQLIFFVPIHTKGLKPLSSESLFQAFRISMLRVLPAGVFLPKSV